MKNNEKASSKEIIVTILDYKNELKKRILLILSVAIIFSLIGFGFSKPTSDMLYTVVSRNARYKTKNFIETAVFRGGDLIAAWIIKMLNLGLSTISLICIPVTLIGVILALLIGDQYNKFYKKLSRKTNG